MYVNDLIDQTVTYSKISCGLYQLGLAELWQNYTFQPQQIRSVL